MEVEHAYAAGLVDGEGTITLSRNSHADRFRLPVVSMTSTTPQLVEWVKSRYGGSIRRHRTYQQRHTDSYIWSVRHNRAIVMLTLIEPYLQEPEKLRRCRLVLSRYKKVTPRNGKYTVELGDAKLEFEREFFHPSTP